MGLNFKNLAEPGQPDANGLPPPRRPVSAVDRGRSAGVQDRLVGPAANCRLLVVSRDQRARNGVIPCATSQLLKVESSQRLVQRRPTR